MAQKSFDSSLGCSNPPSYDSFPKFLTSSDDNPSSSSRFDSVLGNFV